MAEVLKDCGVLHKQHKDFPMVCSASHQSVCVGRGCTPLLDTCGPHCIPHQHDCAAYQMCLGTLSETSIVNTAHLTEVSWRPLP